ADIERPDLVPLLGEQLPHVGPFLRLGQPEYYRHVRRQSRQKARIERLLGQGLDPGGGGSLQRTRKQGRGSERQPSATAHAFFHVSPLRLTALRGGIPHPIILGAQIL